MKLNIPFEKTIKFDTNIYEICSISLEHEITKNEDSILGNFIFEGTYKDSELSINETPFNFIVPFNVDFSSKIDIDSIDFSIDNFTYDFKDNELNIHVNYLVLGKEKEELREDIIEDKPINEVDLEVRDNNNLLNNSIFDDDYITYHIHIVSENETIEMICNKYNTDIDTISKLNDINELSKGSKIIIPINE